MTGIFLSESRSKYVTYEKRHCKVRSNPESSHCYMLLISLPYAKNHRKHFGRKFISKRKLKSPNFAGKIVL
jgi:hypothetical protein